MRECKPEFVTVLDASVNIDDNTDLSTISTVKYRGPMYFDWDNENDLESSITNFKSFLEKLASNGVNLKSLSLYATGGKGFHLEIPMATFYEKMPKNGVLYLPSIYREVALNNVTDDMDLVVYSSRRGRMWRTLGHKRANGRFKVPLTVESALSMTVKSYEELTSVMVPEDFHREPPTINVWLSTEVAVATDKVNRLRKLRAKTRVSDEELVKHFKGDFPETVKAVMQGKNLAENAGFQKIALQLAITANALGKDRDSFLASCEGLCKTYQGDSSRYGSPRKRKDELARMWDYTFENINYSYSASAIKSLLDEEHSGNDLEGPKSGLGEVGELDESTDDSQLTPEQKAKKSNIDISLMDGVYINQSGVQRNAGDVSKSLSNVGFRKVVLLLEALGDAAMHNTHLGIEAEIVQDVESKGRHVIPDKAFSSRSNLNTYLSAFGGIFTGTDAHASIVKLILTRAANKEGKVIYAVHKEGLDVVQDPTIKDRVSKDVIWVHAEAVVRLDGRDGESGREAGTRYTFQPQLGNNAIFNADVHRAPKLEPNDKTKAWLCALFDVNDPVVVAQMLGWFVSCFHKQFYQEIFSQFPLLHPNGPAGSGKTLTSLLFSRMFYMKHAPVARSCGTVTTQFALKTYFTGSASIPVVLDEYKPSEMGIVRTDFLLQSLRLAYNQGKGSSGSLSNTSASTSFRDVTDFTFSTPVCFIAEAQEMQTAIVQRCLPINFKQQNAIAHEASWDKAIAGQDYMCQLGRLVLTATASETIESRKAEVTELRDILRSQFDRTIHDRQVYNLAVVLAGLRFLRRVLIGFGDEVLAGVDKLIRVIHEEKMEINVKVMNEPSKMMNDLSLMSRTEHSESEFALREGYEYIARDGYVEVLMRETFIKYFAWCKRKGCTPYYQSSDSFCSAMEKYAATVDKLCVNSPLKRSAQTRVFRFSMSRLVTEGVEAFKTKGGIFG